MASELSLSALAELSRLNINTVRRIASVMVKRGYLKQSSRRGKFSLGVGFLRFVEVANGRMKVREVAMPFMVNLNRAVDETVILMSWEGPHAVHIGAVPARHILRTVPRVGYKVPLYCTGTGKAILASMTDERLEKYYNSVSIEKYTNNTIKKLAELKSRLLIVKREGIAFDDEEYQPGVRSACAALRDHSGNIIGAVGVLGPSTRLTRSRLREIAPTIKNCASEISKALGYQKSCAPEV